MMTYAFEIAELDAEQSVSWLPNEPQEDFLARVAAAQGKHFFMVSIMAMRNGKAGLSSTASPYFRRDSRGDRNAVFQEAMKVATRKILEREEQLPPEEPESELNLIITP